MILDEGCAERGCPMHDERDTKGVLFIRKEWVGLTKEEIVQIDMRYHHDTWQLIKEAEAKLKEKNT